VIPCTADGTPCLTQLAQMMDARVRLISLTWLPANGGLIQPAQQVGALARAAGVPYVLDAAQAVGQLPVDVRQLGCDVLTAPGRKWLRGPRGTGLLYVRRDFMAQLMPNTVDQYSAPYRDGAYHLRADAKRFETSEACMAARLGLGVAIGQTLAMGVETIQDKVRERAERIRQALATIDRVQLQDLGAERSALVAFTVDGVPASAVRTHLMTHGVDVAVNGLSFTPLDMAARGLGDVVRASPHTDTRDEEIEALVSALTHLTTQP
jgi:cysteine desulfurase / selenocysteine lyase